MRTLIVEDDSGIVAMYRDQIEAWPDDDFDIVMDGESAIAELMARNYDILICDGHIPMAAGGLPEARHGLSVMLKAKERGVIDRWITSCDDSLCELALSQKIATMSVGKGEVLDGPFGREVEI